MSARARSVHLLAALVVAACGHSRPIHDVATAHAQITDQESERLHDECEARDVMVLSREDADAGARARGANFIEVIYAPDRNHLAAVLFACPAHVRAPPSVKPGE